MTEREWAAETMRRMREKGAAANCVARGLLRQAGVANPSDGLLALVTMLVGHLTEVAELESYDVDAGQPEGG